MEVEHLAPDCGARLGAAGPCPVLVERQQAACGRQGRRLARAAAALVVEAPERPVVLLLAGRRQLGGRAVGRREAVGEAVEQAHDGDARADALACRLTWLRDRKSTRLNSRP